MNGGELARVKASGDTVLHVRFGENGENEVFVLKGKKFDQSHF